jgi:probable HAF family extracellular repeat protein
MAGGAIRATASTATIIDLGSLGGGVAIASSLSAGGQVAGTSTTVSGESHAFIFDSGALTDLGTLACTPPNCASSGYAINSAGHVAGSSLNSTGATRAVLWTGAGAITDLGTLGGGSAEAFAINGAGEVTGASATGVGGLGQNRHAFLWKPTGPNGTTGTMVDLGDLGGNHTQSNSVGQAINSGGQVAGVDGINGRAFLWTPDAPGGTTGAMIDLGTLPCTQTICVSSATGINDAGQVVGWSTTGADFSAPIDAFLWTPAAPGGTTGTMIDLGALPCQPPNCGTQALGINSLAQVVGHSSGDTPVGTGDHAVLWTVANGLIVLNTLLPANSTWFLTRAVAINDTSQIAGIGLINNEFHSFLLTLPAAGGDTDLGLSGVPVNITVNATHPSGAVVAYSAPMAVDEAGDSAAPTLSCTPGSGSTFVIGITTVTCTATSADDTPSTVSGTFTVTVTFKPTPASVKADVNQFLASGMIKNAGLANSLLAKLDAASAAQASGDCAGAAAIYQALINELQAQSGKGVAAAAASPLILEVQFLIANCP